MSWTDRVVEYPNRVKLTAVTGQDNIFDMEAAEGTVYVEGTLLNAENLNNETNELIDEAIENVIVETLLWTNANPTTRFDPQTIAINLNDYEYVRVTFGQSAPNSFADVGTSSAGQSVFNAVNSSDFLIATRPFDVLIDGVAFDACKYKSPKTPATASTNNSWLIPQKIYGYKKM